jgi:hypothetical protein
MKHQIGHLGAASMLCRLLEPLRNPIEAVRHFHALPSSAERMGFSRIA